MTFDAELKQTFDSLTERIQAEVARQVRALVEAMPPPEPPPPAPTPAPATAALPETGRDEARLLDPLRAMDDARSLTDILDALTRGAADEAPRVAVLLRKSSGWSPWRTIGFDEPMDAAQFAAAAGALPIVISGETVGVVYAEPDTPPSLEILTRHASRALESMTAFKTARALARQDDRRNEASADEDETAARRYARLLVSEIKLYHESDVAAGRRARDLGMRLGGEIARARALYEQRVPADVRGRADYFHQELVRTLADGDAGVLEVQA